MLLRLICILIAIGTQISVARSDPSGFALVIGNNAYHHINPLRNAVADAVAVAGILERRGFEVELLSDAAGAEMDASIRKLASRRTNEDQSPVILFFAGHGIAFEGTNRVLPVDFDLKSREEIVETSIPLDAILFDRTHDNDQAPIIVIVDSCSNDPFTGVVSEASRGAVALYDLKGGLQDPQDGGGAMQYVGADMMLLASTTPGGIAQDGLGNHSPFTAAFLEAIELNAPLDEIFMTVREAVELSSNGTQVPWSMTSMRMIFYIPDTD